MKINIVRMIGMIVFSIFIGVVNADERSLKVAIYHGAGASKSVTILEKALQKYSNLKITMVGAEDIAKGCLKDFDIIIHPGGSGGGQGKALGDKGREEERKFIRNGGGYLGICAGAYLATCDYEWSLNFLDAKVIDKKHWARGYGPVEVSITAEGKKILGIKVDKETIYYHQGPLLAPAENPAIVDYKILGTFASEIAKNGAPEGVMKGTTAIAAAPFEKGRVFCFSPHPERTEDLVDQVYRAIIWASGK